MKKMKKRLNNDDTTGANTLVMSSYHAEGKVVELPSQPINSHSKYR